MKNYKKPVILTNAELSEGVYAASGDITWAEDTVRTITIPGAVAGQMVELTFADGTTKVAEYTEDGIKLVGEEIYKVIVGVKLL